MLLKLNKQKYEKLNLIELCFDMSGRYLYNCHEHIVVAIVLHCL